LETAHFYVRIQIHQLVVLVDERWFADGQCVRMVTGFLLVIGLTAFQIAHFAIHTQSVRSFPVQVRLGYLLLLIIAAPKEFRWICWVPTIGTWIQVLFGYCPMARTVSLAPWNREQPLSMALLKQAFLSAPARGSFIKAHPS
jgi:hypothetical protein